MPEHGEIRENPGGRRVLVEYCQTYRATHDIWMTRQLNGKWAGHPFGVPEQELDTWELLATLPPDPIGGHMRTT